MRDSSEDRVSTHGVLVANNISASAERIKGFDGVRAVAVLLVLAHHARLISDSIDLGGIGVHIFFALSGFLLLPILQRSDITNSATTTPVKGMCEFLYNRCIRIMPAYYFSLIAIYTPLYLYLGFKSCSIRLAPLLGAFSFFLNIEIGYFSHEWPGILSHFWSLAIEQQFYMCLPLFLFVIPRKAYLVAVAVIAGFNSVIAVYYARNYSDISFYTNSFVGFNSMLIGGGVGLIPNVAVKFWGKALALASLLVFTLCCLAFIAGHSRIAMLLCPVLIGIGLIAIRDNQTCRITRFLDLPRIKALGVVSYGVYLYHEAILYSLNIVSATIIIPMKNHGIIWAFNLIIFIGTLCISYLVASVSYILLERPLLALKRRSVGSADSGPRRVQLGRIILSSRKPDGF